MQSMQTLMDSLRWDGAGLFSSYTEKTEAWMVFCMAYTFLQGRHPARCPKISSRRPSSSLPAISIGMRARTRMHSTETPCPAKT